jgi:transcriptional regulator with XRE-family HTH domain
VLLYYEANFKQNFSNLWQNKLSKRLVVMKENTIIRRKRLSALFIKMQNANDWSAADLAKKIGVSKQTFSSWLNCQAEPEANQLESIARVANLSLDSLEAYLNGLPAPLEGISKEEVGRGIDGFSITELDSLQSLCEGKMQFLENAEAEYQKIISGKKDAPNLLVQMVCDRMKVSDKGHFDSFIFATPLEFEGFLAGKKPNLVVLGIVAEILADKTFSEIEELANKIYGQKTPPHTFPLPILNKPDLSEDIEFPEEQGEDIPPTQ